MAQAISSSNGSEVEVLASIRLPYPSRRLPAARPPGATLSRRVPRARAAVVEDRPAITDQDGFDLGMLAHDTADRSDRLCAIRELGVGRTRSPVTSVVFSSMSASSPRGLAPAHLDHDENGHGLIAIAKPTLTRKGKAFAFGAVHTARGQSTARIFAGHAWGRSVGVSLRMLLVKQIRVA